MGVYRGDLSGRKQGRRARHALVRHLGHAGACDRDQSHGRARRSCVLILNRAGWRLSGSLAVPANISLLSLPSRSSELNPVENVSRFLRNNWLANRIFRSYDDIVAHLLRDLERVDATILAHQLYLPK